MVHKNSGQACPVPEVPFSQMGRGKKGDKVTDVGTIYNRARTIVSHALGSHQLIPQPCEECGNAKTDAHHEDYTKPLEVRWLCRKHHRLLHTRTEIKAGVSKLQVPLDDDLMLAVKASAFKAGKTLRVFVEDVLKQAVAK